MDYGKRLYVLGGLLLMFQKKDYIMSENLGLCHVDDITKMVSKDGKQIMYYVLRSHYNKKKVSYIPVEEHQVKLRELMNKDEAKRLLESNTENDEVTRYDDNICGEIAFLLELDIDEVIKKIGIIDE